MFKDLTVSALAALATFAFVSGPAAAYPGEGPQPILNEPIAGVTNDYWYDYQSDVAEAQHELDKDLARATDEEDVSDARAEYRAELADARSDYVKEMRERGYPTGRVFVGD